MEQPFGVNKIKTNCKRKTFTGKMMGKTEACVCAFVCSIASKKGAKEKTALSHVLGLMRKVCSPTHT